MGIISIKEKKIGTQFYENGKLISSKGEVPKITEHESLEWIDY